MKWWKLQKDPEYPYHVPLTKSIADILALLEDKEEMMDLIQKNKTIRFNFRLPKCRVTMHDAATNGITVNVSRTDCIDGIDMPIQKFISLMKSPARSKRFDEFMA